MPDARFAPAALRVRCRGGERIDAAILAVVVMAGRHSSGWQRAGTRRALRCSASPITLPNPQGPSSPCQTAQGLLLSMLSYKPNLRAAYGGVGNLHGE